MRGTYHCVGENGIPFEVPIRIRPGDAAYLALTPRGDCFWPMKRILCLSVLSALLAACTTTSEIP